MPIRLVVRSVLAVACVAAAVACVIAYASVRRVDQAAQGFAAGAGFSREGFSRVLRDLRASGSPLNPSTYRDQGIAVTLLHLGRPVAAERLLARAAREEPQNVLAWVPLTRVQVARGRLGAARVSWARARRLDPHLPAALPSPA